MSTALNSRRARIGGWFSLAGLFALALSGCTSHGPVNLFGPELFGKHIPGPNLTVSAFTSVSYTTYDVDTWTSSTCGNGSYCSTCFSGCPSGVAGSGVNGCYLYGTYADNVTLVNNGGAGTYGPVQVNFTSPDTHLYLFYCNATQNGASAISTFGAGTEILASSQTTVNLEQGYVTSAGNLNVYYNGSACQACTAVNTVEYAFQFYYTPNSAVGFGSNNWVTVPLNLQITDGLGNVYYTTQYLYINQMGGCP